MAGSEKIKKQNDNGNRTNLSTITRFYLEVIKDYYYNDKFTDYKQDKLVATQEIHGRVVSFYLNFVKIPGPFLYKIGAFYYPNVINYKNKITITIVIYDNFDQTSFFDVYARVRSAVVHEIEHHLQKVKFPFRESLSKKEFENNMEYINDPAEIEAYSKQLYSLHRQTRKSFYELLIEEADSVAHTEEEHDKFISNIIGYIVRRDNDLNMFKNIKFYV